MLHAPRPVDLPSCTSTHNVHTAHALCGGARGFHLMNRPRGPAGGADYRSSMSLLRGTVYDAMDEKDQAVLAYQRALQVATAPPFLCLFVSPDSARVTDIIGGVHGRARSWTAAAMRRSIT